MKLATNYAVLTILSIALFGCAQQPTSQAVISQTTTTPTTEQAVEQIDAPLAEAIAIIEDDTLNNQDNIQVIKNNLIEIDQPILDN